MKAKCKKSITLSDINYIYNFRADEYYPITFISDNRIYVSNCPFELNYKYQQAPGTFQKFHDFEEFFYTLKELRKLKLQKLIQ